jgi:hypothetical protein
MNDIDAFFAEQERRMRLPDEDVDEYIRTRLEALHKDRYVSLPTSPQLLTSRLAVTP